MEHRHEPGLPLYMAVARDDLELHLTEHHGDASPGSTSFVWTEGIRAYHVELTAKDYGFARPEIERLPWGDQLQVNDPFGNRIRFCERLRWPRVSLAAQRRTDRSYGRQRRPFFTSPTRGETMDSHRRSISGSFGDRED